MRRILLALLILNGVFLPLTCIPVLFLSNTINPMALAFITRFTVENRMEATIFVTPIGTVGSEGRRFPLSLMRWEFPWMPASQRGRLPVRSGEMITFYYDWDDINFSELVVEAEDGELRQLVVNPKPTLNQYTIPKVTNFVIDDLAKLETVDQRVRGAHAAAQKPVRWWPFLIATAAPAVTFVLLSLWYKRLKPLTAGTQTVPVSVINLD